MIVPSMKTHTLGRKKEEIPELNLFYLQMISKKLLLQTF